MARGNAEIAAMGIRADVVKELHAAEKTFMLPRYQTGYLKAALDRLHVGMDWFELEGYADLYDDLYMPFFDALGFVTQALHDPDSRADSIPAALLAIDNCLVTA